MNRTAILLAIPLLAACHVQGKDVAQSDEKVTINADENGKVAFDLPFAKGEVKLPGSLLDKGNINLDGVKLMPGSKMTGFSLFGGDKGSKVRMTFSNPSSPDAVRAYYLGEFKAKGLQAQATADGVRATSKDGSPFTIQLSPSGGGTQGTIIAQSKD